MLSYACVCVCVCVCVAVASLPSHFNPEQERLVPIRQVTRWVWTWWQRQNSLNLLGIEPWLSGRYFDALLSERPWHLLA